MKRASLFVALWLLVGFSLGTSTLLGPVRLVVSWCRRAERGAAAESAAVNGIIILLVAATGLLAWVLSGVVRRSPRPEARFGIPALALLAAGGAVWLWMHPGQLRFDMGGETTAGVHFTFGPYPDEERLRRLKDEGYTAVVTLLHPAVVPFEPSLLAEEKKAANRAGIELMELPMLPWVSENTESVEQLRRLAARGSGRYYVHCYLGRDRILLAKRIVEQARPAPAEEIAAATARLREARLFERGTVLHLDDRVLVTPYPNEEEFMVYIVTGAVGHVVSLQDPRDPDDRSWIETERKILATYGVPFHLMSLGAADYQPGAALRAAREVRSLQGTVVVHAFLAPDSGRSPAAEAFIQAYCTGRAPLPPSLFGEPMQGGKATVIAPGVAFGPRPALEEFGAYLQKRGVHDVVCLCDGAAAPARAERLAAAEGRVTWRALAGAAAAGDLLARLSAGGGPWYVYGPGLGDLPREITRRLGPAIPNKVTWAPAAPTPQPRAAGSAAGAPAAAPAPSAGLVARFREHAVPRADLVVLLGPSLLLLAAGAAALAGWLRTARGVRVPYTRKTFHFVIFTLAGALQIAAGLPAVMLFGGIVSLVVLYAVWRGDGFPFYEAMARPTDQPRRALFVLVPLLTTALGGLLANFFFGSFATIGYLVGGWGDAVGEPVGTALGKHRYRVPSLGGVAAVRSLEGSSAVLLAGIAAAAVGLLAHGSAPLDALRIGALCGLVAAAVEAISTHGVDNLTVQVAAAGTAYLFLA